MQYIELIRAMVDWEVKGSIAAEAPDPFHVADALTMQATFRRLYDRKHGKAELEQSAD
jgi:hypothetical protein